MGTRKQLLASRHCYDTDHDLVRSGGACTFNLMRFHYPAVIAQLSAGIWDFVAHPSLDLYLGRRAGSFPETPLTWTHLARMGPGCLPMYRLGAATKKMTAHLVISRLPAHETTSINLSHSLPDATRWVQHFSSVGISEPGGRISRRRAMSTRMVTDPIFSCCGVGLGMVRVLGPAGVAGPVASAHTTIPRPCQRIYSLA
ncbi:hypothetical protein CC78DRAFT_252896 [Lojkania enalia]|uniref:Uncharacterized protein n=1 Tax=Lojkania enalia TaxID=147567 RepID=A0A9P4N3X3_9PLEO|nr:hypothetical protein CC78DRAFT_252896 [Didymosphaeria enalia]